jgi:coenzyme F420-0:L-glutamate ligase/coenzyme F420-1:gamma-L-glutamate ligase
VNAIQNEKKDLQIGDIIIVTQKIVSKSEGNIIQLSDVHPTSRAIEIAELTGKDPKIVEIIIRETRRIVRLQHVLISETKHGFICANAGVDYSNIEEGFVTTLPDDPDLSANRIRLEVRKLTDLDLAVIITDTWGRPWRLGQVDFAIGISGISPFRDYRGETDMFGQSLNVTNIAIADELASAAELVKGKSNEIPVVIIRGYPYKRACGSGQELIRNEVEDLFR